MQVVRRGEGQKSANRFFDKTNRRILHPPVCFNRKRLFNHQI